MYSETVIDHFSNPRNVGEIRDANAFSQVQSGQCGDIMKIFLKIDNNIIKDVKFKTFGCAAAIASSSMATEIIKNMTVDEALQLTKEKLVKSLGGLPEHKMHCSILAEQAIKEALEKYIRDKDRNL